MQPYLTRHIDLEPIRFTVQPADNHRLARLCGAIDENLRQIEQALDVTITRRGEHFAVFGPLERARIAVLAIQRFYEDSDQELSSEHIHLGLIELQKTASNAAGDDLKLQTKRPDLRPRTATQRNYIQTILSHDVTFGIGPAGTGKTYLAVACAVDALLKERVKRIILTRPVVEAGERLGFLPGDLTQKVDPYLRPLYDALYELMGFEKVARALEQNVIEIAPLAYMRGRTLSHAFIILDEAQNTTQEQMKMFLTRLGVGSKTIVTGDITQIDLQRHQKSGLVEARNVLQGVRGIGFCEFDAQDVVRHPLVQRIVNAYEQSEKSNDNTEN